MTKGIPKAERKKILMLSDDMRLPSGVGNISRDLIIGTAHVYNWIQIGAAVQHPEVGRGVDISDSIKNEFGIEDPYVRIYPYNGYGDQNILRYLLELEKPDAILHFTDPRFWTWLYQMEHEIRSKIPIIYYHVWDDTPAPKYNRDFYRSCDTILTISKQTHNIVRNVLGPENTVNQ